ncbi:Xaa-Pro aminopeptidase [Thiomicrospira pelophila]|uniref:Xaa-Pro aminopeptidase n=1 Tax=Thiomicrospira pelophila TaxID=934 RepID=UPI0004A70C3F|nr:Xaa-Pro aminopeptidase [Thiomicrospira pelophila]
MNFAQRRQDLLEKLPAGSVALIHSGEEQIRNRDVEYPFRADSDFIYLTGFTEPDSVLVLVRTEVLADTDYEQPHHQAWLFCRPKDPEQETWQGKRLGVEDAPAQLNIDQAWSIDDLDEIAPQFLTHAKQVYFSFGHLAEWSGRMADWLSELKTQVRKGVTVPTSLNDLDTVLHEQRLFKSPQEIEVMRQAAQISVAGHLAAMRATRPGAYEYQIQSAIEHEFRLAGSPRVAFNTIAAAGENACILHYTENQTQLQDGDLILLDAGAEWQGYAGDISHTYPINGRFSEPQKHLYNLVLKAQQAAINAVQPGQPYNLMHQASAEVITIGLIELEILHGELDELLEKEAFKRFFMHGTGHWLGLDVHDVGRYKINGEWRSFEPGMVVTVEPGLYIPKGLKDIETQWQGIGIRIEDDVLVTENGHEILTQGALRLPRTVEEIEQWMQTNRI